jgi:hypothetical protein
MEDFVTWVDTSKVKRTIMSYNDEVWNYFPSKLRESSLTQISELNSWTTLTFSDVWLPSLIKRKNCCVCATPPCG